MPNVIRGESTYKDTSEMKAANYNYDYPEGLDLKPGSKLHEKIKEKLLERTRESHRAMEPRFDSWNKVDHVLTAYIEADAQEIAVQAKDSRKPVSIVFPYSYAMMETLLTYLMMAFIQDPIFRYEGYSPEDTVGAMLLELVVKRHTEKSKVALNLHTMFRDALAYGVGTVSPAWEVKKGKRVTKQAINLDLGMGQVISRNEKVMKESITYEGNILRNINPYLYLPDPHVAVHDVQAGEFVGWMVRDNLMNLLSEEENSDYMFNVKYLKQLKNRTSSYYQDYSERTKKTTNKYEPPFDAESFNKVDLIYMHVNLIPKDWELGTKETPQKWLFCLAGDEVILECRPMDLNHDLYPVAIAAPEFDGYSGSPISRLEILYGLQGVLDFMFNSHVTNVRKAINDMIIVDPQMINMKDLENPEPGKLIRLRRPAWGRGVKDVAMQLKVEDVTRQNIADSAYIVQWMQKVSATDDAVMGSLRTGGPERLTGTEFQGTRAGAASRLERIAKIIGIQAMQDIGYMFASHTQQLMSEDTYVKIIGRYKDDLVKHLGIEPGTPAPMAKVSIFDLLIDYDVSVRDGSIPGGNFSEAWLKLFEVIGKTPMLAQQFDVFRLFSHIALSLGAKNIDDFQAKQGAIQTQVMPDEQVQQQAQAGNIVPFQPAPTGTGGPGGY